MSKYNNGKIYKIIDNTNGNIYIGSTVQKYITTRLAGHVKQYKQYLKGKNNYVSSFEIIKNENYDIVLLENVNCETKEQLHARERFYIETIECINMCKPNKTKEDKNRQNLEYHHRNKEQISEKKKTTFICDCGSECRISDKPRHLKTIKHQTFLCDSGS
jgi:hypothetical protein